MEHRPYPKIPSVPDPSRVSPNGVWVATEKIHGAHLVVGCDGKSARIGKRKAWLEDGDPFFGWQLLRASLLESVRAVQAELGGSVRLYGEIFGGAYPHGDVAALGGLSAVQTGIWYSPGIHYSVFDVVIDDREFLAHREVEALATSHGLVTAPLLGRGMRRDIDALPTRFDSLVAASFGLPPIEGNVAEGLVVKPDQRAVPSERFTLKRKIPEFDDARFGEAEPLASDVLLDLEQLIAHAERLVNPARIASARSKVGESPSAIRDEVVLDVLVDLEAAFPFTFGALPNTTQDELRDAIYGLVPTSTFATGRSGNGA